MPHRERYNIFTEFCRWKTVSSRMLAVIGRSAIGCGSVIGIRQEAGMGAEAPGQMSAGYLTLTAFQKGCVPPEGGAYAFFYARGQ